MSRNEDIHVVHQDGQIAVYTPFNDVWRRHARSELGGQWQGGAWMFDTRDEARVRELLRSVYGTDGTPGEPLRTVRVTIPATSDFGGHEFQLAGRTLAWRASRDAPVRTGLRVVIIAGTFPPSGGSMRRPELANDDPVLIEVRDVPAGQAALMVAQHPDQAEIIDADTPERAELEKERAQLAARIAEIDTILTKAA